MYAGESYAMSVTMRNTGNTTWAGGFGVQARLAESAGQYDVGIEPRTVDSVSRAGRASDVQLHGLRPRTREVEFPVAHGAGGCGVVRCVHTDDTGNGEAAGVSAMLRGKHSTRNATKPRFLPWLLLYCR
jgi:hypothetical protein